MKTASESESSIPGGPRDAEKFFEVSDSQTSQWGHTLLTIKVN